jgi:hypothetical protein
MLCKEQHDERGDRAEADAAERRPKPGTQTAPITLVKSGRTWGNGATGRRGATSSRVNSGISVVASAIAAKPWAAYRLVPAGAPTAKAAYIAVPTQAIIWPIFCGPTSANPQANAPVTMKLSAPPSTARPRSRIVTDVFGSSTKRSDRPGRRGDQQAGNECALGAPTVGVIASPEP